MVVGLSCGSCLDCYGCWFCWLLVALVIFVVCIWDSIMFAFGVGCEVSVCFLFGWAIGFAAFL